MCVTGWSLAPVAGTKETGTLSPPHFPIAPSSCLVVASPCCFGWATLCLRLYSCLLLHLCRSWWTRRTSFRIRFPCLISSWRTECEVGDHGFVVYVTFHIDEEGFEALLRFRVVVGRPLRLARVRTCCSQEVNFTSRGSGTRSCRIKVARWQEATG